MVVGRHPLVPVPPQPAQPAAGQPAAQAGAGQPAQPAAVVAPAVAPKKGKNWAAFAVASVLCIASLIMSQNDKEVALAQIASAGKGPIPGIPAKGGYDMNIPIYGNHSQPQQTAPAATSVPPAPAYVAPTAPVTQPQKQIGTWGPVVNLSTVSGSRTEWTPDAAGHVTLCSAMSNEICLPSDYTAGGPHVPGKCLGKDEFLAIEAGTCAYVSKL